MAEAVAVAGGMQMMGNLMQGQAQANALDQQATMNEFNANESLAKGRFDANRSQIQSGKKIGNIEAGYGASGVTATSGSVMDIIRESTANAELDRLNILHGADLKAIQYQNQASMERAGATSARRGAIFGAAGSVAATGGRMAAMNTGSSDTSNPESTM